MTDKPNVITGRIVRILDDHTVVLNVGSEAGVEGRMRYAIYTPYDTVTDPETGEDLGSYRRRKGAVVVQEIAPRFCVAAAPAVTEEIVEEVGGILGFGPSRTKRTKVQKRELNIDYDQVKGLPTGDTVRVGDIVEQVVR